MLGQILPVEVINCRSSGISADEVGPKQVETTNGKCYVFVLRCFSLRLTWGYLVHQESDVHRTLKRSLADNTSMAGVEVLRKDAAGEFIITYSQRLRSKRHLTRVRRRRRSGPEWRSRMGDRHYGHDAQSSSSYSSFTSVPWGLCSEIH